MTRADPVARQIVHDRDPGEPYFAHGNIISLAESEIVPLEVIAQSKSDYVEWEINGEVIIDGTEKHLTIRDRGGKPFRVTGGGSNVKYRRYYEWAWSEQPPRLSASATPKSP